MGYERIELLFARRRIVKIDRIPYLVAAGQHVFCVEDQIPVVPETVTERASRCLYVTVLFSCGVSNSAMPSPDRGGFHR
jgi:hypothetical protein